MKKRWKVPVFLYVGVFVLLVLAVLLFSYFQESRRAVERHVPIGLGGFERLADAIVSGGPPRDGIPAVDSPRFVSAAEADAFLKDSDIVFGLVYEGVVRAYPQKVLVWHEIVNDVVAGVKLAVTYCPLTGTVLAFLRVVDGAETTFGTSGSLLNSNLVMYDRATASYWPQVLGVAVTGKQVGKRLGEVPMVWTTWGRWKARYPQTEVLSRETGFLRSYGSDPYGSYERDSYYTVGGPFFPVRHEDGRLPAKEVVVGLREGGDALAVAKAKVKEAGVLNLALGEKPVLFVYDEGLDAVVVYSRLVGGKVLSFRLEGGSFVDEGGVRWSLGGVSARGRLERLPAFDAMWFAWVAFYPETELVA